MHDFEHIREIYFNKKTIQCQNMTMTHLGSEMFSFCILCYMKGTITRLDDKEDMTHPSLPKFWQIRTSPNNLIHNDIPYFLNEHRTVQGDINLEESLQELGIHTF